MYFRVYLMNAENHIRAAHPLSVESEAEAIDMSRLLYSSCDDIFKACEVWRGPERLYHTQNLDGPGETLAEVSERRQRLVAEMEETLAESFSCVRTSRKLLKQMDTLKERLGRTNP
jgi:hypothetical protein